MSKTRFLAGTGVIAIAGALVLGVAAPVKAEVGEVRLAQQFGVGYLPLQMMREFSLIEKEAAKQGLSGLKVTWSRFSGGRAMNDALLSDNVEFASGGVGPLLTIWDKSMGNLDVKGVSCLNNMPLFLNTTNPKVKSLKDFTEKDKIALPAVKVSVQARTLQMAVEKEFGEGNHYALTKRTVSMKHPDGVAAMLSGGSEITAHLTSPPFQYQELQDPKVRTIVKSYDVLGGMSTFNCVWARAKFRNENPKTYKAVIAALGVAMEMINADKKAAAAIYIKQTKSKLKLGFIEQIVTDPDIAFTMTPKNTMKYAGFMFKVGALKHEAKSWKDYFFPEIHDLPGS